MPEAEALQDVLKHMYAVHKETRPEHPEQTMSRSHLNDSVQSSMGGSFINS